jgi:hypothetical protein
MTTPRVALLQPDLSVKKQADDVVRRWGKARATLRVGRALMGTADSAKTGKGSPSASRKTGSRQSSAEGLRSTKARKSVAERREEQNERRQTVALEALESAMGNLSAANLSKTATVLDDVMQVAEETNQEKKWPRLANWWQRPRGFNVRIGGAKKEVLARFDLDTPAGGVCYGGGRIPIFEGRGVTNPASCFTAMSIDRIQSEDSPELSFGIGVSTEPPDSFKGDAWRAYNLPNSWVAGYGKHFVSLGAWQVSPWDPATLKKHDVIGVMVLRDPPRDFLIFVNGEQKMRLATDIPPGELYLIVDLFGMVTDITLTNQRPPKNALKARNVQRFE